MSRPNTVHENRSRRMKPGERRTDDQKRWSAMSEKGNKLAFLLKSRLYGFDPGYRFEDKVTGETWEISESLADRILELGGVK